MSLQPIRKPATHKLIFERIRRAIHLGAYLPGDRLPPGREIADQLAVSRETVRDAVKLLIEQGYVTQRRGPGGGLTVTSLAQPVAHMRERLHHDVESFDDLMEFRRAIESLAARLAADRRTDEDLQRISQAIEAIGCAQDIPLFRKADSDFHLAVASAAQNPYVEEAIEGARDAVFLLIGHEYPILLGSTLEAHSKVFRAIRGRDPEAAAHAMAVHIEESTRELHQVVAERRGHSTPAPRRA